MGRVNSAAKSDLQLSDGIFQSRPVQLQSDGRTEERLSGAADGVQGLGHAGGRNGQRDETGLDGRRGRVFLRRVLTSDVTLAKPGSSKPLVTVRTEERFGT